MTFQDFFEHIYQSFVKHSPSYNKGKIELVIDLLEGAQNPLYGTITNIREMNIRVFEKWFKWDAKRKSFESASYVDLFKEMEEGREIDTFVEQGFIDMLQRQASEYKLSWESIRDEFAEHHDAQLVSLWGSNRNDFYRYLARQCHVISCGPLLMTFQDFFNCLYLEFKNKRGLGGIEGFTTQILNASQNASIVDQLGDIRIRESTVNNWLKGKIRPKKGLSDPYTKAFIIQIDGELTDIFVEENFANAVRTLAEQHKVPWERIRDCFAVFPGSFITGTGCESAPSFYSLLAWECHEIICRSRTGHAEIRRMHSLSAIIEAGIQSEVSGSRAHPSSPSFLSSSPSQNALFTGREEELLDLAKLVQTHGQVALWGLAGVGKSEVLRQFYFLNHNEYDHSLYIEWKYASGSLAAWYELFSSSLDIPTSGSSEGTPKDRYERSLSFYKEHIKGRILIVIDAIPVDFDDDVIIELSKLGAFILFSSRRIENNYSRPYQLDVMIQEEARELFCAYSGRKQVSLTTTEKGALEDIEEMLEGHPLGLELIARVHKKDRVHLTDIVDIIRAKGFFISESKLRTAWNDGKQGTIKQHFERLFALHLFPLGSPKADIISLYALFPGIVIPMEALMAWMNWEADMIEHFGDLQSIALLTWDEEGKGYLLHPVITEIGRYLFPLGWQKGDLGYTLLLGLNAALESLTDTPHASPIGFEEHLEADIEHRSIKEKVVTLLKQNSLQGTSD